MESPLADRSPDFVISSSATTSAMPALVPLNPPNDASPASPQPTPAGIGAVPWILGGLCLVACAPLGIPALVIAVIARSVGRQSADAVRDGDLYEAARLLARSRRYRSISLGCSAAGLMIVGFLMSFVVLV